MIIMSAVEVPDPMACISYINTKHTTINIHTL